MIVQIAAVVLLALAVGALLLQANVRYAARNLVATVDESGQEQAERVTVSGTLTYHPDNRGVEQPYVVYEPVPGVTVTKALVFSEASICRTASNSYPCALIEDSIRFYYGGNPVSVTGLIVAEHVVVETLVAL